MVVQSPNKIPPFTAHNSAKRVTKYLWQPAAMRKKVFRLGPFSFATPAFTGCAFVCTCTPSRSHAQNFTIFSVGRYAGLHTQPFARVEQKSSRSFFQYTINAREQQANTIKSEEGFQSGIVFLCNKSPLIGHKHIQSGPFAYKVKQKRVKPQLLQAHRWCWCRSAEIHNH